MLVARDKDGTLHMFPDKFGTLNREDDHWRFYTFSSIICGNEWFGSVIDKTYFPELKWEDEPLEVELTIKAKEE